MFITHCESNTPPLASHARPLPATPSQLLVDTDGLITHVRSEFKPIHTGYERTELIGEIERRMMHSQQVFARTKSLISSKLLLLMFLAFQRPNISITHKMYLSNILCSATLMSLVYGMSTLKCIT